MFNLDTNMLAIIDAIYCIVYFQSLVCCDPLFVWC